jgi:hypothetical protein
VPRLRAEYEGLFRGIEIVSLAAFSIEYILRIWIAPEHIPCRHLRALAVLKSVATPGINVIGMTMLLQFVVSFGFILVVNAPQNMVAYGTETFSARDFVRTGLVLTVIALALVMLLERMAPLIIGRPDQKGSTGHGAVRSL